jgi:hypothetical protein
LHTSGKVNKPLNYIINVLYSIYNLPLKYNNTTLQKLEKLITEAQYIIRNERGNFQSGYCILEQKKVLVINKFLSTEGKINTLIEIIPLLKLQDEILSAESSKTLLDILTIQAAPIAEAS